MKVSKLVLMASVVLLGSLTIQAEKNQLPNVSVTGVATEKVAPDVMNWQLRIESKGADVTLVAADHTKTAAVVLGILKSFKVSSDKTQTTGMSFGEEWRYRSGSRVKEGYKASTNISFQLKDFSSYSGLWTKLSTVKNVSVSNVSYDYSKRKALRSKMRVKALLNAKARAVELAETLGSKVGEPLLIEEGRPSPVAYRSSNRMMASDSPVESGQSSVAAGQIEVKMEVSVSFRLLTP
ncbi:MAG: SIMPL domain-containing protein [Lentisphaeria bacterium]|nr:SIMPL domain-containing protein [Lentisphaeria bacterium]